MERKKEQFWMVGLLLRFGTESKKCDVVSDSNDDSKVSFQHEGAVGISADIQWWRAILECKYRRLKKYLQMWMLKGLCDPTVPSGSVNSAIASAPEFTLCSNV